MSSHIESRWLRTDVVRAIHEAQLEEHGGVSGVRSEDLLASALTRPQVHASLDEAADLITLGAMYASALVRNHAFADGNKRTAWVAMITFLGINGVALKYSPADVVHTMRVLASDSISDEDFTGWVRRLSIDARV